MHKMVVGAMFYRGYKIMVTCSPCPGTLKHADINLRHLFVPRRGGHEGVFGGADLMAKPCHVVPVANVDGASSPASESYVLSPPPSYASAEAYLGSTCIACTLIQMAFCGVFSGLCELGKAPLHPQGVAVIKHTGDTQSLSFSHCAAKGA